MADALWSSASFSANNITIHYLHSLPPSPSSSLASLPLIFFLHGLTMSAGTLIPAATSFTHDFEVILPDARGHGSSSPIPKGSFLMNNLVLDAMLVLEKFGLGRPVFLMGHSMGAATAARLAKLRPDLIRGLILEEPPWDRTAGAEPNTTLSLSKAQSVGDTVRVFRNMSNMEFHEFDTEGLGILPMAMSPKAAVRAFDIDDCEETLVEVDIEITEAVEGVTVPLELQMGDVAADYEWPFGSALNPRVAAYALSTYPLGSFQFFRDGGHLLHTEPTVEDWTGEVLRYFRSFSSVKSQ